MKRFFTGANYDFLGLRRKAYVFSAVWLGIGLMLALVWQVTRGSWLNYGVDFAGGALIQVEFDRPVPVAELRALLDPQLPGTQISEIRGTDEFMIRAPQAADTTAGAADAIPRILAERYGQDSFTVHQTEFVGPKVGGELRTRAAIAILLSFAATLIYLAFRFEWRFGTAAVITTVHDIALTLMFITALRLEVALTTVAAVLTIVGYSLNDTIVIFDRIRENLRTSRREDFLSILNRSINETLPRTVLTGVTTLGTLFALFLVGAATIREFALIMIMGIALGTYSSIFIAAPTLLAIERRWPGERKKARVTPRPPARAAV